MVAKISIYCTRKYNNPKKSYINIFIAHLVLRILSVKVLLKTPENHIFQFYVFQVLIELT